MKITIDTQEIVSRPNDFELGKYVREKYWIATEEMKQNVDEHVQLEINEDGLVVGISSVSDDEYDSCVICGRKTQYLKSTNINFRHGYVEGAGQTCDGSCRN